MMNKKYGFYAITGIVGYLFGATVGKLPGLSVSDVLFLVSFAVVFYVCGYVGGKLEHK